MPPAESWPEIPASPVSEFLRSRYYYVPGASLPYGLVADRFLAENPSWMKKDFGKFLPSVTPYGILGSTANGYVIANIAASPAPAGRVIVPHPTKARHLVYAPAEPFKVRVKSAGSEDTVVVSAGLGKGDIHHCNE